jgi:ketosteroid isomerase-like protein
LAAGPVVDGCENPTSAGEWWTSKQILDAMAAAGDDDIQVVADDLDVHVLGDAAWAEGRGRFTNPGGSERPVRMTAVLVREDGRWRVAQSHAPIGVPNADIFT